jgi:hypothetical protein
MSCDDVRHGLLTLLGGPIGLTDWALLGAHMKHCAECRDAEAHLRRVALASQLVTRPRATLLLLRKASVAAAANALEAVRLTITRSVKRTIRFRPSVQAVAVVLALAFTLSAPPRADGPEQLAGPAAPPRPEPGPARPEPERAEPVQLAPSLSPPSVEQQAASAAPPRTAERRQSPLAAPPRAAPLSPPDVSASELATHVVGQLSAKNARTVQRDFLALLADAGGTELGRRHQVRFTAVEVLVPQSRYREFADGLARIGSWRLEAARFPLPDAVHMTIRVNE